MNMKIKSFLGSLTTSKKAKERNTAITAVILTTVMTISSFVPTRTAQAAVTINDTGSKVEALKGIKFTGSSSVTLDWTIASIQDNSKDYPIFSIGDPRWTGNNEEKALDKNYSKRKNDILLGLSRKYSATDMSKLSNTTLSNGDYLASLQLSFWRINELASPYKIDTGTVPQTDVKKASDFIISKVEELDKLISSTEADVVNAVTGIPSLKLESATALGNVKDGFNYYGPYKFYNLDSKPAINVVKDTSGRFEVTKTIGGESVTSVTTDELFYLKFKSDSIEDLKIPFKMTYLGNTPKYYTNYVSIIPSSNDLNISITVKNSIASGIIEYTKTTTTGEAIPGVTIKVTDLENKLVASVITDAKGKAVTPALPINRYFVQESETIPGIDLDTTKHEANLESNGQVFSLSSKAQPKEGFTTFKVINSDTKGSVLGSTFDIYDKYNVKVAQLASADTGEVKNTTLKPGSYTAKEIKASPDYELLTKSIPFEIKENQENLIEFSKKPAFSGFVFTATNADGTPAVETVYNLYDQYNKLIYEVVTDYTGKAKVSLPAGNYYLKQRNSDTSTFEIVVPQSATYVEVSSVSKITTVSLVGTVTDGIDKVGKVYLTVEDKDGKELIKEEVYSDYKGKFEVEGLEPNTPVYLRVTKVPEGYDKPKDTFKVITGEYGKDSKDKEITITKSMVAMGELNTDGVTALNTDGTAPLNTGDSVNPPPSEPNTITTDSSPTTIAPVSTSVTKRQEDNLDGAPDLGSFTPTSAESDISDTAEGQYDKTSEDKNVALGEFDNTNESQLETKSVQPNVVSSATLAKTSDSTRGFIFIAGWFIAIIVNLYALNLNKYKFVKVRSN